MFLGVDLFRDLFFIGQKNKGFLTQEFMKKTTKKDLISHLKNDLKIEKQDIVFLFSAVWGLGILENGIDTITEAFEEVLPEGLLIVPTFSYSWCKNEAFSPEETPCPDMGVYADSVWKDSKFVRTNQPNFSVCFLKNEYNGTLIKELSAIDHTCFGKGSIFGKLNKTFNDRNSHILLLGGAFKDCLFRCTFIHMVQRKVGVPNRYIKKFYNPSNNGEYVEQLVRFQPGEGKKELVEDFSQLGEDLFEAGLLTKNSLAYYDTRAVKVPEFCEFYERKLREDIYYCLK
tara:strand:- start:310 stop:1167 length:858 start_codon:yes stop_codon:yes gene_type:complete